MNMLRISEEELQERQRRLKAKLPVKVHLNELRTNKGTSVEKPPVKAHQDASKTRQKRSRRIPGYVAERDVLRSVLEYLKLNPRVSWAVRINTGATKYENRFVRFGSPGFPDVIGQMKDGRLLAIECKASNGNPTPDQEAFIAKVVGNKGLGCIARSVDDVRALLSARPKYSRYCTSRTRGLLMNPHF
jgi:hypothetical protein